MTLAIVVGVVAFVALGARSAARPELPSWRVIYADGAVSYPLRRDDAMTRAKLFGGVRVEYCRDSKGNLL